MSVDRATWQKEEEPEEEEKYFDEDDYLSGRIAILGAEPKPIDRRN